ncbi:DUF6538 domain-containing protein [Humitalea sp. 24SJ18S-53]|uniref:DUF6538 domain-containing protein n=1 Tax=Humitalea sp. 24SJ18S-53 TaxID=3422307 RepID=UPI003D678D41
MVLPMPCPIKHPKSGVYRARQAVPAALRPFIGKTELLKTLGTKDPAEAKRRFPEVIAEFDEILAGARAQLAGTARRPSPRQIAELAGEYYRSMVPLVEDAPGTVEEREIGQDLLREESGRKPSGRRYAEAEGVLQAAGYSTDPAAVEDIFAALLDARWRLEGVGLARASRDWSPDPNVSLYPVPRAPAPAILVPAPAVSPPALTLTALLDAYDRENPKPPKTQDKRRTALRHLETAAGHDDARRIGKEAISAMKEARLKSVGLRTVNDDIATLRPVWAWALNNGKLPPAPNPFTNMANRLVKRGQTPRGPFTHAEAVAILTAARDAKGFLRWLPWVLALTGCRLEEACGSIRADVREESGVLCLVLADDRPGRELKNAQSARKIPLHPALIEEGFVEYLRALPADSPLFPDVKPGAYGRRGATASKIYGRWVRKTVGVTDTRKDPAHGWRHWMADELRAARVPEAAADALLGHKAAGNAGSGYGDGWRAWPDRLLEELAKVPSPLVATDREIIGAKSD